MQIAILDDDAALGAHVGELLGAAGHSPVLFRSGKTLMKELRQESFDLLLLDWSLPETSGIEVLAWVRENLNPSPPVIMITARANEADIVEALGAGADDYVTKPIQDGILKARVEAVLRRTYGGVRRSDTETYGDYVLDLKRHTLTVSGRPVETTAKEFALALLLFRNLERPLSRSYIMDAVWGAAPSVVSRTLDAHVSQIRNRLGLRPENGLRLSSVYGFGYRMDSVQPSQKTA